MENKRLLLVSLIFVFIVIVKVLLSFNFYGPYITPDELRCDTDAHMLSDGILYQEMGAVPPLYPAILSISYHLSADKEAIYHIMLIIGIILSTLTIFPAYLILKKYINPSYAILGAVAVTTMTALNFFSFTLMFENLFFPLVLFTFLAIIEVFDTNKLYWQILAGISVACLEIARSPGLIIEVSFLLTFIFYLIYNRKSGIINLIKNKMAMILAFFLIFSMWHIFLYLTSTSGVIVTGGDTGINVGNVDAVIVSGGNIGASNDGFGLLSDFLLVIPSTTHVITFAKMLLNQINYVLLASYFIPVFVIFYLAIIRKEKKYFDNGYEMGSLYIFLSLLLTWLSVTILNFNWWNTTTELHMSLGRYMDPLIPPMVTIGIISICKLKPDHFKRYLLYYILLIEVITISILYVSVYDFNIFIILSDCINNPSLTYLFLDDSLSPYIISAIAILSTSLLCLAIIKKKFVAVFLLFIIATSLLTSYPAYSFVLHMSRSEMDDNIVQYLQSNSSPQTLVIIDKDMTVKELRTASYYGFWNAGMNSKLDINDSSTINLTINKNVYLLTKNNLSYTPITASHGLTLYYNCSAV